MKYFLLALLWGTALIFSFFFSRDVYKRRHGYSRAPWGPLIGIGFITNFFDTLGIGSFAPTTSFYKFGKLVDDRVIPGTLNVGHSLPTIAQALIFITVVQVAPVTLISMMFSATLGAVLGAGVVSKLAVNKIRLGLGGALLLVATAMLTGLLNLYPSGGDALGLTNGKLIVAVAVSFVLGSLMTIGIGIYAPCMALVFALGLTALGVVAVPIAAYVVKSLPLTALKWVIVGVIIYTSVMMFRSARKKGPAAVPHGN
jgi:uncharacterized membrane protein YfcA